MAVPAHTAKNSPTGYKMPNGWISRIGLSVAPGLNIWEIGIKPRGIDTGGPIDTTTMLNTKKKTKASKVLQNDMPLTITFAYDPDARGTLESVVGAEGSISQYFPTGDYEDFYGYIDKVEFSELKVGEFPTGTMIVEVTDWDTTNHVEVSPAITAAPGT